MYRSCRISISGFTLVELLVVISIIGILSSSVYIYASQSGRIGRDADRQADLRALQSALELYKQREGRYPEGCNGPNQWSGESGMGTGFQCASGGVYIEGLAPTYIPVLPRDPKRGCATDCGYAYVTNDDGTVYKLIARKSVESEVVDYTHPMKSCDVKPTSGSVPNTTDIRQVGLCGRLKHPGAATAHYPFDAAVASAYTCSNTDVGFTTTYGVWGGFAPLEGTAANRGVCNISSVNPSLADPLAPISDYHRVCAVAATTEIICK
ncbi:prepilin-type N-terminal cleavage/methylation domain-containing protein [Patescibacteria group bacterium]|nr:prepilin-type N-terminal cleavage/methylation domain-containing protein [Patescibacteria group bacterium]